jgi:CheY-like chemotaxis protein
MQTELHARVGPLAHIVRNPGILLVDDHGLVLTLLKLELEPRGFSVWLALNGNDAVDVYRRHQQAIDLVLLDVEMPGLDGPKTLAALRRINPQLLAAFMTGGPNAYSEQDLLACGASLVFCKPFQASGVARFLQLLVCTTPASAPAPAALPGRAGWASPEGEEP